MTGITDAENVDEQPCQIYFSVVCDNKWFAAKNPKTMLNRSKAIVDVAHVPMKIFHSLITARVFEKLLQHRSFKIIVVTFDFSGSDSPPLSNLVYRERKRLRRV